VGTRDPVMKQEQALFLAIRRRCLRNQPVGHASTRRIVSNLVRQSQKATVHKQVFRD
jgi:hypothetical protein